MITYDDLLKKMITITQDESGVTHGEIVTALIQALEFQREGLSELSEAYKKLDLKIAILAATCKAIEALSDNDGRYVRRRARTELLIDIADLEI